jgi:hypothetical protein
MRAALGLALAAGGVVLALLVLHGRTPFDVSMVSGASGGSAASTPSYPIQNPTAAQTIQHFGGLP